MKEGLKHTQITLQLLLIAAMLSTSFLATQGFFNTLIISKQYGLEVISLIAGALFVVALLSQKEIKFTKTDLLVVIFAIWYVINELYNVNTYAPIGLIIFNLLLWGLVYMFVRQSSENPLFVWGVVVVWMVVVLLQSGLGLMQLYGLERSYHGLFRITGTFHNPGPFSGFVVSGLPLALGVICYLDSNTENHGYSTEEHRGIYLKWFNVTIPYNTIGKYLILALAWITLIAILLVLPPAQSRAAWIAGIAGGFFVLTGHPALIAFNENLRNRFFSLRKPIRIMLLTAILLPLATVGFGLYAMKKGSADGRMLMWQVTIQLIKENPLTGHGTGAFNALYMNEQANWFASGKGTEAQAMVAGSPEAPFNEPLKLWLEKGLIAMLLAGGILYFIFFKNITPNHKLSTINSDHKSSTHPSPPHPLKGELQAHNLTHRTISSSEASAKDGNLEHKTSNFELQTSNSSRFSGLRFAPKPSTINYKPPTHPPQPSKNHQLKTINPKLITGIKGALISLLTFSLFSYPFDISTFILQLVVLVALLAGTNSPLFKITGKKVIFLTLPVTVVLIAAAIHFIPQRQNHYQAMKTWHEADRFYSMRSYNIAAEAYAEAFPVLKTNGLFLQMYGKALSMNEQYQKSNEILAMAQQRFSSQIIQNTLGDNHKTLGNYPEAEAAFTKSANMIPSLLLPKYLLAKLYNDSGQHHKAQQTAEEILNSLIKVESSATREIMNEMKNLVTQSVTENAQRNTE
ncbi:O-antigen ligase family protein [Natronoflexus pectinivorans]|uniref:O-antigen ligase n=1 Tax=Natronoflexus pectinivorans TaxID=682526 RepID=A0A4V2RW90_9BACT|nr:O-antigen ligase family protein [Natronoflexus pectinivorans]TCO07332.1 O-antigen ligase [Natronoflexus pectinivorans]